jgi:hypothetical protein
METFPSKKHLRLTYSKQKPKHAKVILINIVDQTARKSRAVVSVAARY